MLSAISMMPSAWASSSLPSPEQENVTFRRSSCADASLWSGWTLWLHLVRSKRCSFSLHSIFFLFVSHTNKMPLVFFVLSHLTSPLSLLLIGFHLHQGNILPGWSNGTAHYMAGAISVRSWCKWSASTVIMLIRPCHFLPQSHWDLKQLCQHLDTW